MEHNQRRHPRLSFLGQVPFHVCFRRGEAQFDTIAVLSLSAGGLFCVLPEADLSDFQVDDRLVGIRFLHDELQDVSCSGRVAHILRMNQMDHASRAGFGVAFLDLSSNHEQKLAHFVDTRLTSTD